ncbi:MAG: hypothetical protein A4E70_00206 [Syntrophus sp. PtaU1.Bin005]|nr:MAG: hypothetical protein A4E70_00206 [Syntrophus sp. PtaU1.Bin005]
MSPEKNNKYHRLRRDAYVDWEILESEAFQSLNATAIRVFLRFLQKRTFTKAGKKGNKSRKQIFNNHGLIFTYAEALAWGIPGSTFLSAIKKLIEVGLVDLEHQGGPHRNEISLYAISERWIDYGTDAFKHKEKSRVLQQGCDVHSRLKKIKDAAETCSEPLQKAAVIDSKQMVPGIRNLQ